MRVIIRFVDNLALYTLVVLFDKNCAICEDGAGCKMKDSLFLIVSIYIKMNKAQSIIAMDKAYRKIA